MSEVSASFIDLISEANKRGTIPGWPEPYKLQSLRQDFNAWVQNHGMKLDSVIYSSPPSYPNERAVAISAIKLALFTLNSQIQLLRQDFSDGPGVRTASGAQSNASSVERSVSTLSRWMS
ncbi:hypothetical protein IL306_004286 [Fusarium sp. DS 682]|nr:hypothetical protein IL306_004286 [Fusarium sp. DS 682]